MFKRPHHQRIATLLGKFNPALLSESDTFFGGGTAIALLLEEYRESVNIDFICSSKDGYRLLRNTVSQTLGDVLTEPIRHVREVKADRYGIRTFLEVDDTPIKVEIILEDRIQVKGEMNPVLGVPVLSVQDMFCEKLLANADRGIDRAAMSRDIIDIAMMIHHWGNIPEDAWLKVYSVYGKQSITQFHRSIERINNSAHLDTCLDALSIDKGLAEQIVGTLNAVKSELNHPLLTPKEERKKKHAPK